MIKRKGLEFKINWLEIYGKTERHIFSILLLVYMTSKMSREKDEESHNS